MLDYSEITELNLDTSEYPIMLKELADPPKVLYCKGIHENNIFAKCLAVVGSRKVTPYGIKVTNDLVSSLVQYGFVIVSGFMHGVDQLAHSAALKAGGKTIAVMPGGVDLVIPRAYQRVYDALITGNGMIVSEYPDQVPPKKWAFPRRNRIVMGLSLGVVVIEGAEKSGSLITARLAQKYKRPVFAIPGSIYSMQSRGTNQLIKEGALLISSAKDILSYLEGTSKKIISESNNLFTTTLTVNEKKVLSKLSAVPLNYNQLLSYKLLNPNELDLVLSNLLIKRILTERHGFYYVT